MHQPGSNSCTSTHSSTSASTPGETEDSLYAFANIPPILRRYILSSSPTELEPPDFLIRACRTSKAMHDQIKLLNDYWARQIWLLLMTNDIEISQEALREFLPLQDYSNIYFRLRKLLNREASRDFASVTSVTVARPFFETFFKCPNHYALSMVFQMLLYSPTAFKTGGVQNTHGDNVANYRQRVKSYFENSSRKEQLLSWQWALRAGNLLLVKYLSDCDETLDLSLENFKEAIISGDSNLIQWLLASPRFKGQFYRALRQHPERMHALEWISDEALANKLRGATMIGFQPQPYHYIGPMKFSWSSVLRPAVADLVKLGWSMSEFINRTQESLLSEIGLELEAAAHAQTDAYIKASTTIVVTWIFWRAVVRGDHEALLAVFTACAETFPELCTRLLRALGMMRFSENFCRSSPAPLLATYGRRNMIEWLLNPDTIAQLNQLNPDKKAEEITRENLVAAFFRPEPTGSAFEMAAYHGRRSVFMLLWELASPEQRQVALNKAVNKTINFCQVAIHGWADITRDYLINASPQEKRAIFPPSPEGLANYTWVYFQALSRGHRVILQQLEQLANELNFSLVDLFADIFPLIIKSSNLDLMTHCWSKLTPQQQARLLAPGKTGAFYIAVTNGALAIAKRIQEWMEPEQWQAILADEASYREMLIAVAENGLPATFEYLQQLAPAQGLTLSRLGDRFNYIATYDPKIFTQVLAHSALDEDDDWSLTWIMRSGCDMANPTLMQILAELDNPDLKIWVQKRLPELTDNLAETIEPYVARLFTTRDRRYEAGRVVPCLEILAAFAANPDAVYVKFYSRLVGLLDRRLVIPHSYLFEHDNGFDLFCRVFPVIRNNLNSILRRMGKNYLSDCYYNFILQAIQCDDLAQLAQLRELDTSVFDDVWKRFISEFEQKKDMLTKAQYREFSSLFCFYNLHSYLVEKKQEFGDVKYTERFDDFAQLLADLKAFIGDTDVDSKEKISDRMLQIGKLTTNTVIFMGIIVRQSKERYRTLRNELAQIDPELALQRAIHYLNFLDFVVQKPMRYSAGTVTLATTLRARILELTTGRNEKLETVAASPISTSTTTEPTLSQSPSQSTLLSSSI